MSDESAHFSDDYAQARQKFLDAATAARARIDSHPEPATGMAGERLAMDVARLGPDEAALLLVISSGCHGVEGYCGSGVQDALLQDAALLDQAHRDGVALLFIHALNPWGFSHGRRVTREGVDLNRNMLRFERGLQRNAGYDDIAQALLPAEWPPTPAVDQVLARYAQAHGAKALQAAISAGQYHHPDGLFHGGTAPTWSNSTLRLVLRQHGTRCARLGWIDVHSGLGASGVGERIFACRDDATALHRAQSWWGPKVTSAYDGSSTSVGTQGNIWEAAYEECAQAQYTGIGLEFGTQPMEVVRDALRADHWVARSTEDLPQALREGVRLRMREAFFTDTPAWKQAIVAQGREVALQGVRGLARHG
ncbi:MAG TPA: M14 family metallopeptidase [Burkholderiaceae bacterium]|nr:M14 family metallopeptidase [Burkholderiaceae bacterium]